MRSAWLRAATMGVCLAVVGLVSDPSMAQGTLTPYAAEDIEYNTNIFYLPNNGPKPVGNNGPSLSDTFFETRAGIEGTYLLDQQKFFGTAEFRRFQYDNFHELDHNEELFDGGLKWKLASLADGLLEYKHEQRMVPFQALEDTTSLILETENTTTASVNFDVTPEWRLETLGKDHLLDSPRSGVPGLSLHEDSIREGLRYLGMSNLSAGVDVEYLEGKYRDDPLALTPDYHQVGGALAATYIVSGLTNFTGTVGYTHRADPTTSNISGLTGNIAYQRSLSAKTALILQVNRALATYITTGGNEVDTTASANVHWQATYKILVKAGYSYTRSTFPGMPDGAVTINRLDHYQTVDADLTYQVLHWLSIRPYARYQTRHSNENVFTFNGSIVGVELLLKRPRPKP